MSRHYNPFALSQLKNPALKFLIQKISKIDVLERWYDDWLKTKTEALTDADSFIAEALKFLNVNIETVNGEALAEIPSEGPFIVVANHPLGGVDGLVLMYILKNIRPDLKVLTNELLSAIPEFSDVFIGVDVLRDNRAQHNARGIRDVARHLSKGGALLVFPAGTVSRIVVPSLKIADAPWSTMIVKLAKKYNAAIMPVFVEGRHSRAFYLSAYIHKRIRTLLLPRAMLSKAGRAVKLHIGLPISAQDLKRLGDDTIATYYIRLCCKVMGAVIPQKQGDSSVAMADIEQDICTIEISRHIENLSEFHLYQQGDFSLYCAPYDQLGPVMKQLSIEREHTFRSVEEGTGKELDSDRFDPHYMHLFLWDEKNKKIAGGYRLGKTDEIVKSYGLDGLYSRSLFQYNQSFLKTMGKTVEVGRSFVTQEYQKNPAALDILWKGIGRYMASNTDYHTLFGCVSISRQYSRLASAMLTETFLFHYGAEDSISRNVKARIPIKTVKSPWTSEQLSYLSEIPVINKLVGRIDAGKSIPILIRHYLALNGRFMSFTVNEDFNSSLDGLIMVDLRTAPNRYLKRYMGEEGLQKFQEHHNNVDTGQTIQ